MGLALFLFFFHGGVFLSIGVPSLRHSLKGLGGRERRFTAPPRAPHRTPGPFPVLKPGSSTSRTTSSTFIFFPFRLLAAPVLRVCVLLFLVWILGTRRFSSTPGLSEFRSPLVQAFSSQLFEIFPFPCSHGSHLFPENSVYSCFIISPLSSLLPPPVHRFPSPDRNPPLSQMDHFSSLPCFFSFLDYTFLSRLPEKIFFSPSSFSSDRDGRGPIAVISLYI